MWCPWQVAALPFVHAYPRMITPAMGCSMPAAAPGQIIIPMLPTMPMSTVAQEMIAMHHQNIRMQQAPQHAEQATLLEQQTRANMQLDNGLEKTNKEQCVEAIMDNLQSIQNNEGSPGASKIGVDQGSISEVNICQSDTGVKTVLQSGDNDANAQEVKPQEESDNDAPKKKKCNFQKNMQKSVSRSGTKLRRKKKNFTRQELEAERDNLLRQIRELECQEEDANGRSEDPSENTSMRTDLSVAHENIIEISSDSEGGGDNEEKNEDICFDIYDPQDSSFEGGIEYLETLAGHLMEATHLLNLEDRGHDELRSRREAEEYNDMIALGDGDPLPNLPDPNNWRVSIVRKMNTADVMVHLRELRDFVRNLPSKNVTKVPEVKGPDDTVCTLCMTNLPNMVCLPCKHSCFCDPCVRIMVERYNKDCYGTNPLPHVCPVCRAIIGSII